MTATCSQGASIALVVAVLAVFVGPLVVWTVARRQLAVTAREAWMRQFREQVAALLTAYDRFVIHASSHTTGDLEKETRLSEITDAARLPYHTLRLFVAERAPQYDQFKIDMDQLLSAEVNVIDQRKNALVSAAELILQTERAATANASSILCELWISVRGSKPTY